MANRSVHQDEYDSISADKAKYLIEKDSLQCDKITSQNKTRCEQLDRILEQLDKDHTRVGEKVAYDLRKNQGLPLL